MTLDEEDLMPQFILEIPNCEETISNPILVSALTRIIRTYKWYRDFDFKFLNLGDSILVKGSEIDLLTQDRSQQRLTTDQTVEVEVSERYNEEMVRATHIKEGTEKNIFHCDKTKTTMHPGYQQMIADISIKFRFRSRHAAENFRKRVQLASTKSVDGMKLEVKYTYAIPYAFLDILKRIYELMENRHGYGISLGDWLRESFTKNLTTLANQSGGKAVLAIAEVNQNVLVLVNSPDEIDRKEKDHDEDSYSVTMEFTVYYDRPDVMRLRFQHLINNQFVGMDIANRFKVMKQDYLAARTHIAQLDVLKAGDIPIGRNPLSGAVSPIFDDWLPPSPHMSYPDAMRIMLMLDEDNLHNVIDLNDIADYELTQNVKNWIRKTKDSVFTFGMNIFWIRVWAWDKFGTYNQFHIDDNLIITSEEPLDPRVNYHITIGLNIDPGVLDDSVWEWLREERDMLDEWLGVLFPDQRPFSNVNTKFPLPKPTNFIDRLIIDYERHYRDTSERPWFDETDMSTFDPKTVNPLPPKVIDQIKNTVTSPGNKGVYYDGNPGHDPSGWERGKSLRNNWKTVLLSGVIVKKKGVNYA